MNTAAAIASAIGTKLLSRRIGVVETAVFNAVSKGVFPPKWYAVIKAECTSAGIECPDELFSFIRPKHPASKTNADDLSDHGGCTACGNPSTSPTHRHGQR